MAIYELQNGWGKNFFYYDEATNIDSGIDTTRWIAETTFLGNRLSYVVGVDHDAERVEEPPSFDDCLDKMGVGRKHVDHGPNSYVEDRDFDDFLDDIIPDDITPGAKHVPRGDGHYQTIHIDDLESEFEFRPGTIVKRVGNGEWRDVTQLNIEPQDKGLTLDALQEAYNNLFPVKVYGESAHDVMHKHMEDMMNHQLRAMDNDIRKMFIGSYGSV